MTARFPAGKDRITLRKDYISLIRFVRNGIVNEYKTVCCLVYYMPRCGCSEYYVTEFVSLVPLSDDEIIDKCRSWMKQSRNDDILLKSDYDVLLSVIVFRNPEATKEKVLKAFSNSNPEQVERLEPDAIFWDAEFLAYSEHKEVTQTLAAFRRGKNRRESEPETGGSEPPGARRGKPSRNWENLLDSII